MTRNEMEIFRGRQRWGKKSQEGGRRSEQLVQLEFADRNAAEAGKELGG